MEKKMLGEERRQKILEWLKESKTPITGGSLAKRANVSRQVIVNDISLLKAKNEPILSTNEGYLYIHQQNIPTNVERTIACSHSPEKTEEELNIIVDHGVTVVDVKVEHPVYGYITAPIKVSTRKEVKIFVEQIKKNKAPYLLELTGGVHLHTLSAPNERKIDEAVKALKKAGILYEQK